MKTPAERPLADDLAPRLDDARLARQWSAVAKGLSDRPRRTRRSFYAFALAPGALVLLALLALVVVRPWAATGSSPVVLARSTDALVLADGSRVTLSSGAELVLESATRERVHLLLAAGAIELDVTHVTGRPFVVSAGGHDVTVRGTAFAVKVDSHDGARTLTVNVTRGRVDVTGPTGLHTLDAGQSWSSRVETTSAMPPASGASSLASRDDAPSAATSAAASAAAADPGEPTTIASAAPPTEAAPSAANAANAANAPPVEGPRELLARATEARTGGRPRDAAVALDTLRKRYRSDARAGLAAFELGRVRMDALNDPAGAAEAFADAIALSPTAPFREDAEARRVEALDALPDRARCERVRDAYLARYPAGLHARQIATRCKTR
jgi:transmembrane sensor